jgi:ADP-heptose:LPS heptosyltransferase
LDLIISVDTSVAHLAGALGKKVFLMLPYAPDYRWMDERPDTPWYPTMTLFRQPKADDWTSVVSELCLEIKNFFSH